MVACSSMVDLADGGLKGPRTRFVTFPTRKLKSAADK
jgi:hypothetical protein